MKRQALTIKITVIMLVMILFSTVAFSSYAVFDTLSLITGSNLNIGSWSFNSSVPISTAQEFYDFATSPTSLPTDRYYLTNDIDFTGFTWDYNSTYDTNVFQGEFDGKGYTLSNISVTSTDTSAVNMSIFSSMTGGTIKNVTIDNYSMDISSTFHASAAIEPAVLATRIYGAGNVVSNITFNNVQLIANSLDGPGLIASYTNSQCDLHISNIKATNVTLINESKRAGGIIGRILGTSTSVLIEDVDFQGFIASENRTSNNGAIVGTVQDVPVTIRRVIAEYNAEATYVFTNTTRTVTSDRYTGGIIGNNNSASLTIENVFYTGELYTNTKYMGAIMGREKITALSIVNAYYANVLFNTTYTAPTNTTGNNGTLVNATAMPDNAWWNTFALNFTSANSYWAQDGSGRLYLIR